ncbi:MAG: 30S ribosomal protein S16 [Candidatus Melainabacteria bacterium]|nr:30S ribosomal protein S16 [Candidatus Melainabacteria bacterium]
MLKIRLKRIGRKKRPFYRIVVTDIRTRRDGAPIAELGYYDPIRKLLKFDVQQAKEWILKGAEATGTVAKLLDKASPEGEVVQLEMPKPALSKKQKAKQEAEKAAKAEAEKKAAEPAPVQEAQPEAAEEAPAAVVEAEPVA